MIFHAELPILRQFRIIFENQAPNPARNSRKLPHGNAKKGFLVLKCRTETRKKDF